MNHTDAELQRLLQHDDALAAEASVPDAPRAGPSSAPRRSIGLLVALLAIAAAIGSLVVFSLKDAAVYAKSVDQLVAGKAEMIGRRVRVEGVLVHGSLMKRDQPCEYRFRIAKNHAVLEVRYPRCVIPDTFQDREEGEVGVTAEGSLRPDGSFEATQIMAKCPSKYEQQATQKKGTGAAN